MTEEKELLTILSKEEYEEVLLRLIQEFGEPEVVKRLALQSTDYRWADVDARIRITNGKAEIIQKVGDWKKQKRQEIIISLPSNPRVIFDMYKIFMNAMRDEEVLTPIMQLENLVWRKEDFEIKLTHQFGKKDAYNCEIEVFDMNIEPEYLAQKYKIPIHLPVQTQDFWRQWNEEINLSAKKLSNRELLAIIKNYL